MDDKISSVVLLEKVTVLSGKVDAAHGRVDKLELWLREDLKEIKDELKILIGWMNRGKGWAAATLLVSGVLGGAVATLVGYLIKK